MAAAMRRPWQGTVQTAGTWNVKSLAVDRNVKSCGTSNGRGFAMILKYFKYLTLRIQVPSEEIFGV